MVAYGKENKKRAKWQHYFTHATSHTFDILQRTYYQSGVKIELSRKYEANKSHNVAAHLELIV